MGYIRQADYIKQGLGTVYSVNKPKGIWLNYSLMLDQRHHWSFGGENIKDELDAHYSFRLKNYWIFNFDLDHTYNEIDTRQLRGGPSLRIDDNISGEIFVQTNSSKNMFLAAGADLTRYDDKITYQNEYDFLIQWQVSNSFTISSRTGFSTEINNSQYVFQKR